VVVRLAPPGAAGTPGGTTKGLKAGSGTARGRCAATLGAHPSKKKKHRTHRKHRRKARSLCCRPVHKSKRKGAAHRRAHGRRKAVWALHATCGNARRR
jgi:hypothetical protein